MQLVEEFVSLLRDLLADRSSREQRVREYRHKVWDYPEELLNESIDAILRDLAYDLEFYEPDPILREQNAAFFGDDRLVDEISTALVLLKNEGIEVELYPDQGERGTGN